MRKLLIVLLVVCFLFGMATRKELDSAKAKVETTTTTTVESAETEGLPAGGVKVNERGKETGIEEVPLIKPEEEPVLYKTSVKQITPKTGIMTGHVIAYGHYIKPPYKFEIREDTLLFLNGIRIYPCLPSRIARERSRRENEKKREAREEAIRISEPHRKRLRALFNNAQELYQVLAPKKGREAAVDSICKLLRRDSLIVDIKAVPQGKEDILLELEYYLPGFAMPPEDPWGELLELRMYPPKLPPPLSKEEKLERKKRDVIMMKESTEKDLTRGDVLIIPGVGSHWIGFFGMDFDKIVRILKNSELSFSEKQKRLEKIGVLSTDAAKEILFNFDPQEWPGYLRRKND